MLGLFSATWVQHVECFHAELESLSLGEMEILERREIGFPRGRADHRVALDIDERPGSPLGFLRARIISLIV
jgi:hypothetical protein